VKLSHNNISYESKFSEVFCATNTDYKSPWEEVFGCKNFEIEIENIPKDFLPDFSWLKDDDLKLKFYLGFIVLVAECQVSFEQALLLTGKLKNSSVYGNGLEKFQKEELIHSLGYRHFLSHCKRLDWPRNSLLLGKKRIVRKALYYWVKKFPRSIFFVGAKAEIFSLCYAKLLKKTLGPSDSWNRINQLHFEDEVFHIPFAMQMHNEFQKEAKVSVLFSSYITFIIVQFLNLTCCYQMVKSLFPKDSYLKTLFKTLSLGKWIVRDFEAYQSTRKILKNNMTKYQISKLYRLMAR